MIIISVLSEALLYICLSFLLGSFILQLVPVISRPAVKVPKVTLLTAALGVAFFSFVPVLKIILYLYHGLGLGMTITSVLLNFEVGKSWISTGVISLILFIYILPIKLEQRPIFSITALLLTVALIATIGWSSHASSLSRWPGFVTHTTHMLAISIWVGILLTVSWFSKNHENWFAFLKWYSPVAMICLFFTILSGLALMTFVMNLHDYVNSWTISYGQALLIKHLAIAPLLVFAFINSSLIRKKMVNDSSFSPLPWARLESVTVILIFSITGSLSQQSPPHEISTTIQETGTSKLFNFFHQGVSHLPLHFRFNVTSMIFLLTALFFLTCILLTFVKRAPKAMALIMSILFILASYLAFMYSV
ncbi:copper resistance D family protein [Bacillus sp. JJ1764]|uniref:copper resistance D family protein n=1 Tax=Bacillus sp. JJ1764 TaxID=3122964 RepID=UPI002FFFF56B